MQETTIRRGPQPSRFVLLMGQSSQRVEPPQNPGRFTTGGAVTPCSTAAGSSGALTLHGAPPCYPLFLLRLLVD